MELPEQDRQAFIDAARRRTQPQEGGAAFGLYPSSGKRPEKLNVSRDVNMPAQTARGWVAGTLGLPGDIEGLGRLLVNMAPAGQEHERVTGKSFVGETPVLPTSDFYREWLPGGDERPAAQFASGLGALAGGAGSTKVAGAAVKGAKATGKALGPKAAEMAEGYLQKSGLAPSVVKPKGGNWLSGSVETATKPLVPKAGQRGEPVSEIIADLRRTYPEEQLSQLEPGTQSYVRSVFEELKPDVAVEDWINKKLNRYIKNEMATPEDPVRKLAERDVLHVNPEQLNFRPEMHGRYLAEGQTAVAQSPTAKTWEGAADLMIAPARAGELLSKDTWLADLPQYRNPLENNPWLEKVSPDTSVYALSTEAGSPTVGRDLGFDHLIDELRNATRADSDLPANLRWKPEDLQKVTMEQAVERVAKINEYRAAKKAEANEVLARNPATAPYRDYQTVPGTQEPNSKGLSWKQIKPFEFGSEGQLQGEALDAYKRHISLGATQEQALKSVSDIYGRKVVQDALKYEGDVMGHCVGGYCDDVLQGKSQIYSLRDKKGEPHVTIEVENPQEISDELLYKHKDKINDRMSDYFIDNPDATHQEAMESVLAGMKNYFPPSIAQIKGKGNAAPKAEYLPFVQDFVRSGQWSKVGDFKNTGLIEVGEKSAVGQLLKQAGETNIPPYVTRQEYDQIIERFNLRPGFGLPQGYAKGGLVQDTDAIVAQLKGMDKDKALTQALRMANAKQEAHMAAGGLAKLLKGAKKAEDAAKVAKPAAPTIMPPVPPMTKDQMRPIAQRVANQMTGEFVRPDPKFSINPAGKSQKVFQRERDLPVEVTQRIPQKPAETIDIEKYEGYGLVGVPGDPTLGGVAKPGTLSQIHEGAEELKRLGDVEFESPVQLFGGPRYGAYNPGEEFWASNIGPARTLQNRVTSTSEALDAPVLGQYIKMSPESTNFALHNLDALLSYMQPEKLGKKSLQELNDEIRKGSPKLGKFPGFAGFEDPIDVLLQSQMHSDLRKHIAETLMKPTVAKKFGLRPGSDVLFGISEPKLRELEAGISGYSVGQMKPGAELTPSLHPTYDYDIPGTFIGQSKYPTPYEIAFPASTAYTRSQLKPGVQEFNMLKMVGPREKIDPQYIDQIKMYEELMKEYTGKKKGGLVKKSGLSVLNKAII